MSVYHKDKEITDNSKQLAIEIKIALGDEGMQRVLSSGLSDQESKDPTNIWGLMED